MSFSDIKTFLKIYPKVYILHFKNKSWCIKEMFIVSIILLVFLLLLSAFFSGVEVALVSISDIELRTWVKQRKPGSKSLQILKSNPKSMIITILIGNNIVNIAATAIATILATDLFGNAGAGIAVGVMTFLVLIFGEITPKAYCTTHYEQVSLLIAKPILILKTILWPFVYAFRWISNQMIGLFGGDSKKKTITQAQLRVALDISAEENVIDKDEKRMLKKVLRFDDVSANEVMTAKKDVFFLDANMQIKHVIPIVSKSLYSRFPLYENKMSNIVGIVHLKDILEAIAENEQNLKIREIAVMPLFIPDTLMINDIFKKFQETHRHIAIVVDKKRTVMGLVTIEDLLEEIVGEIIDESDVSPNNIMRLDKKTILVDGETPPRYLKSFFRINIPKKFDNVSDYLINKCRGLPARGLEIKIGKVNYKIEEVGEDHIERVVIRKL